eukprot:Anaeramoba_ignava/a480794_46.p1 GENE.a480794_46~~a480794_46.p1  ORF type:complete len:463 (+),score=162.01 a480794_46:463-1851(+)
MSGKNNLVEIQNICINFLLDNFHDLKNSSSLLLLEMQEIQKLVEKKISRGEKLESIFLEFIHKWFENQSKKIGKITKEKNALKTFIHTLFSQLSIDSFDSNVDYFPSFQNIPPFSFLYSSPRKAQSFTKEPLKNATNQIQQQIPQNENDERWKNGFEQMSNDIIKKNPRVEMLENQIQNLQSELEQKNKENVDLMEKMETQNKIQKLKDRILSLKIEINQKDQETAGLRYEVQLLRNQNFQKERDIQSLKPFQQKLIQEENQKKKEEEKKEKARIESNVESSSIVNSEQLRNTLKTLMNNDQFFYNMKLGFSSKRDGSQARLFHEYCDNKGATLVLIKSDDGFIFGGFTEVGWPSLPEKAGIKDPKAYLFSLKNIHNSSPTKLFVRSFRESFALLYDPSYGPCFGNEDLSVTAFDLSTGDSSRFGYAYHLPYGIKSKSTHAKNYFAGRDGFWKISELECFFL